MEDKIASPYSVEETVRRLIRTGNALAHATGHVQGCPKISPAIPCTCGCSAEQAAVLTEWYRLVREMTDVS